MPKYELVKQKFEDRANKSWAAEYADTIVESVLGVFDTLGVALRFRKFIVDEKKYSESPTGVCASEAYYVREKAEDTPAPDPARKPRHGALLSFQGHSFEMPVVKAMELKALMEAFIPGAVVLVEPNEEGTEVVGEEAK